MNLDTRTGRTTAPGDGDPALPGRFRDRFLPILLLGVAGVASLPLTIHPNVRRGAIEGLPESPPELLTLLLLINPLVFLAAASAVGAALAPRLGLRSLTVEWRGTGAPILPRLRPTLPLAIGAGLATAALVVLADLALQPFLSPTWQESVRNLPRPGTAAHLLTGLLYGGITEEILLRWGMLSLLAWLGWRLLQGGRGAPRRGVLWGATVIAAVLFGIGHLPAAAAIAPLDAIMVLRVVALNAAAGIVYGWLYWRHHLEAAMLAHASTHLGFALAAVSGVL